MHSLKIEFWAEYTIFRHILSMTCSVCRCGSHLSNGTSCYCRFEYTADHSSGPPLQLWVDSSRFNLHKFSRSLHQLILFIFHAHHANVHGLLWWDRNFYKAHTWPDTFFAPRKPIAKSFRVELVIVFGNDGFGWHICNENLEKWKRFAFIVIPNQFDDQCEHIETSTFEAKMPFIIAT